MNKAITDGVLLMPPAFANGLNVWSSGDGTPGSDTYDGAVNAAYVPSDQDFGGCLEMLKSNTVQQLRYMGETPILPGCYLRVSARVKAVSGNLPSVRIAAWAGNGSNGHVGGVVETGPSQSLTSYGDVVEVSAIIGAGARGGVDMAWGTEAIYGHFGLDLTGSNGGVVRIDDLVIEDVTSVFLRSMMNCVDVRDYGAVGDGAADDAPAFHAAIADANGRDVLVPSGTFYLGDNVTFETKAVFEGKVTMPVDKYLTLSRNFDLASYIEAFEDEELAFKKAFQSLLNNADHETLDLSGRRITISEPIDMQAAVNNRDTYAQRRVIRNGQFYVNGDTAWEPDVVTSVATYSVNSPKTLSNVTNVANIQVGSLVEGNGVGREVYVRSKNEATQELELSQPFFDGDGTQTLTFTRFKYVLDFTGFKKLSMMVLADVDFLCNSKASGVILSDAGVVFHVRDCFFTKPKHRGITSPGYGCQGMLVDRCQFITAEGGTPAQDRISVAVNANGNDVKVRNNRASQFRHFLVVGGANTIVTGNHFFQGDSEPAGLRTAGIILGIAHVSTSIDGNYVDNCSIEWTNEYDATPDFSGGYSFSALSVTDNVFLNGNVAPWSAYLVIKPHGIGQYITGLCVTGNKFRSINGTSIDRVDRVDTSYADLDMSKGKNILFEGNTFHAVTTPTYNPLVIEHTQNTHASTWVVDSDKRLPFGGHARAVEAVTLLSKIKNTSNVNEFTVPYVDLEQGADGDKVELNWQRDVAGTVAVRMRMD